MKKNFLNIFLIFLFCSNSIVYAIGTNPVKSILFLIDFIMTGVILYIIINFLMKIFKVKEKKKLLIKFINTLSVALILKWGAFFWIYGILYVFDCIC